MSESGMPLLSGPPTSLENPRSLSNACRKCNKEFNVIFVRSRKCQHCGYLYCTTCSDYQALMPRQGTYGVGSNSAGGGSGSTSSVNSQGGPVTGYDVVNVCAFCVDLLQITAGGKNYLKSLPLAKLRKYANAYNISIGHAVEKDDVIEAIMSAKVLYSGPNGCLTPENEVFYRKYSVPDRTAGGSARPRGIFARSGEHSVGGARGVSINSSNNLPPRPPQPQRPEFARPDLEPDPHIPGSSLPPPQPHAYSPPPPPPPRHQYQQQQQQQRFSYQQFQPDFNQRPPSQYDYTPPPPPSPRSQSQQFQPFYSHPQSPPPQSSPPLPPHPPPPPPPPPRPPPRHWGSHPYAQNTFYSTWGYPPEPDHHAPSSNMHAQQPNPELYPHSSPPPPAVPPRTPRPQAPPSPQFHSHPQAPPRPAASHSPPAPQSQRPSPAQSTPTPTPAPAPTPAPRPTIISPPDLNALLDMPPSTIKALSISALKSILFTNHVNVNATMVLEKSDLVSRVMQLVDDEKRERERARAVSLEEQEEEERLIEMIRERESSMSVAVVEGENSRSPSPSSELLESTTVEPTPAPAAMSSTSLPSAFPQTKRQFAERSGLCVICQDDEANIAIVDCGHLAMCKPCSELVMTSSRECPLCRTRIVTEARLLRIFKS